MTYLETLLGSAYRPDMTADQISAALENIKAAAPTDPKDSEAYKAIKAAFDKASSEVSELKKQAKADGTKNDSLIEQLQKQVAQLQADKELADLTARFTAAGYSAEDAAKAATAYTGKDLDGLFALITGHTASAVQDAVKAAGITALKGMPAPAAGGEQPMTREAFDKLGDLERVTYIQNHPGFLDTLK